MTPPSHAVVALAALDLRRRPDHRAELRSQLLLGEVVRVLGVSRDGLWWRVENGTDGYQGWSRTWGLVPASARRARAWQRAAAVRVKAPWSEVRTEPGAGALVGPLFLNGRVIPGRRRGAFLWVELPDARQGWAPGRDLAALDEPPPAMLERVRGLLGVPYLWGGRTPLGFDCSGFVQQVLSEQGVALPRDAHRQFVAARLLPPGVPPAEGDLVFFGPRGRPVSHVGLGLGGLTFAHSRGRVRIGSLDPESPLWDGELSLQSKGWRRVPC